MTYCPHGCIDGFTDLEEGTQCPLHSPRTTSVLGVLSSVMDTVFDPPSQFGNYDEYLASDHWQRKRRHILVRSEYRCERCGKGDHLLDVHHRTYENRGWELSEDLIALCRACHDIVHGKAAS